jgi:hypothetical protein
MYFSFIRPILEYGDVVWDTQTHYLINKIENVQSEAARIVTGGTKLTSIQKLYEETGWEKLLERREKHKLILLYKIVNNQAPGYLRNLLPGAHFMSYCSCLTWCAKFDPIECHYNNMQDICYNLFLY